MGHKRTNRRRPKANFVRYASNSDLILRRSERSEVPIATDAPQQISIRLSGNSTHIYGTCVPVEEPSTAS